MDREFWRSPVLLVGAGFLAGLAVALGYHATQPSLPLKGSPSRKTRRFCSTITKVIDGDTVVLENGLHLRYRSIDTPEIVEMREVVEPFAAAALERNRSLVEGKSVSIELAPKIIGRYGRLIGSVILPDGKRVEDVLVAEGLARVVDYDRDDPRLPVLRSAEKAASAAGLGIWSRTDVPARDAPRYVASVSSKIYHIESCPKAANIKPENRVLFGTEKDARSTGRAPCPYCFGR